MAVGQQIKFDLRAVFWREGDQWHGQALELDTQGAAPTLKKAVGELLKHAHREAKTELENGHLPGRPISLVPDDIRGRWQRLKDEQGGELMQIADIYLSDTEFTEVALQLTICLAASSSHTLPEHIPEHRILLTQEAGWWVAQALEFDICAQGREPDEAIVHLQRAIFGRILLDVTLGVEPLSELSRAPTESFESYERARDINSRGHRARIAA